MSEPTRTNGREQARSHPRVQFAIQAALVTSAALLYFLIRGLREGSFARAEANAWSLLRWEGRLGIDIEHQVQGLVLDHDVLITLVNWVYIWGHWPVIIATLAGLYRWHPAEFRLLRNALFVSGAIGLMFYVSIPVAPPRLLEADYRDTVTELSSSYRVLQPPSLVNKYAALPSLHAGWNLLAGLALFRATSRRSLRALAVAGPIAMAFAVVATGNHYVIDVIAGELIALVGWLVALRWGSRRPDAECRPASDVDSPPRSSARVPTDLDRRLALPPGARWP
jgi:membrane-associated phospholipid phosphatase